METVNSIKERRIALGLTQPQLAALLKDADPRMDVSMVSRFETETCLPTENVLKALETALQATRSELYSGLELAAIPELEAVISPYTAQLAEIVPFGRENAISRAELAARLYLSDRQMRRAVSQARREGLCIINDQTGGGYYRSDNADDLKRQLRSTHNRALSLLRQEKYLKERIKEE